MEQTSIQLDEDEERFRKLQMSDQANFEDKLDTLQVGVFALVLARGMGRGGTPSSVSLDVYWGWVGWGWQRLAGYVKIIVNNSYIFCSTIPH